METPGNRKSAIGIWDREANLVLRKYVVNGEAYRLNGSGDTLFVQVYKQSALRMLCKKSYARDIALMLKLDADCKRVVFFAGTDVIPSKFLVY